MGLLSHQAHVWVGLPGRDSAQLVPVSVPRCRRESPEGVRAEPACCVSGHLYSDSIFLSSQITATILAHRLLGPR